MLAKELQVSVITTKRACEELERDGFIETVTGRGSFVAGRNLEFVREEQFRRIEEHLTNSVDIAEGSGFRLDELKGVLETLYEFYNRHE